jgi:hypothetical protein
MIWDRLLEPERKCYYSGCLTHFSGQAVIGTTEGLNWTDHPASAREMISILLSSLLNALGRTTRANS